MIALFFMMELNGCMYNINSIIFNYGTLKSIYILNIYQILITQLLFRACLDTSETGNLASCKLMGEFSEDPLNNFSYITASDRMSYSFNIHNDGNVLEIVSLGCECILIFKY